MIEERRIPAPDGAGTRPVRDVGLAYARRRWRRALRHLHDALGRDTGVAELQARFVAEHAGRAAYAEAMTRSGLPVPAYLARDARIAPRWRISVRRHRARL
ncbi:MAG: hypothetical protein WCA46_09105 [Actinocatenispora sp.]